ncbi:hypothetical protein GCK72_025822 [Caenorhabditis remanei]|uniref:Uncharacterized protein n=1 Tax=Caenorhabditis remanei TaxID=31234 RepID=A0A6A5G3R4_CAERE|nr:hypothetical protein GCK72_025822 [Caenorhabditis remanei]KAF1749355.1 hypothetical protein GCK72_025822 [Caenorhabditis remanei]
MVVFSFLLLLTVCHVLAVDPGSAVRRVEVVKDQHFNDLTDSAKEQAFTKTLCGLLYGNENCGKSFLSTDGNIVQNPTDDENLDLVMDYVKDGSFNKTGQLRYASVPVVEDELVMDILNMIYGKKEYTLLLNNPTKEELSAFVRDMIRIPAQQVLKQQLLHKILESRASYEKFVSPMLENNKRQRLLDFAQHLLDSYQNGTLSTQDTVYLNEQLQNYAFFDRPQDKEFRAMVDKLMRVFGKSINLADRDGLETGTDTEQLETTLTPSVAFGSDGNENSSNHRDFESKEAIKTTTGFATTTAFTAGPYTTGGSDSTTRYTITTGGTTGRPQTTGGPTVFTTGPYTTGGTTGGQTHYTTAPYPPGQRTTGPYTTGGTTGPYTTGGTTGPYTTGGTTGPYITGGTTGPYTTGGTTGPYTTGGTSGPYTTGGTTGPYTTGGTTGPYTTGGTSGPYTTGGTTGPYTTGGTTGPYTTGGTTGSYTTGGTTGPYTTGGTTGPYTTGGTTGSYTTGGTTGPYTTGGTTSNPNHRRALADEHYPTGKVAEYTMTTPLSEKVMEDEVSSKDPVRSFNNAPEQSVNSTTSSPKLTHDSEGYAKSMMTAETDEPLVYVQEGANADKVPGSAMKADIDDEKKTNSFLNMEMDLKSTRNMGGMVDEETAKPPSA